MRLTQVKNALDHSDRVERAATRVSQIFQSCAEVVVEDVVAECFGERGCSIVCCRFHAGFVADLGPLESSKLNKN